MITTTDIIYYSFYILCLFFSFIKTSGIKGIILLRLVLVLGLANELWVELMQYLGKEENFSHFIYIPAEYILLCFFYAKQVNKKLLGKLIVFSIPFYLLSVSLIAFKIYAFRSYPSIIYNIGCILSVIWLTLVLFNLEIVDGLSITRVPAFWIISGLLIFYAGVYFFNTAYSFFLADDKTIAQNLRIYINLGLNIILYSFWTYAFICSAKMKNYTYH